MATQIEPAPRLTAAPREIWFTRCPVPTATGLAYKLEYADEVAPEDVIFEDQGVKVLVDPKSLPYIEGTQLDFVREGLNEGFKFNNPNERDRCGCGESFRI